MIFKINLFSVKTSILTNITSQMIIMFLIGKISDKEPKATFVSCFIGGLVMGKNHCWDFMAGARIGEKTSL